MAEKFLDAVTIYNELSAMGHDNTPAKQRRKSQLHGYRVQVYDQNGMPSPVQADQVEKQVSKRNFRKGNMFLTLEEWVEDDPERAKRMVEKYPERYQEVARILRERNQPKPTVEDGVSSSVEGGVSAPVATDTTEG